MSGTSIYRRRDQVPPIELYGRPIWTTPFLISIPFKDTCSTEYLRLFGMPTVGDATIDAQMHNQLCERYVTINAMVEFFKLGITVRVVQHADTKNIYDIINNYLLAWKENLEHGINIGDAPVDDLIELDRFAGVVYQHAVQHFTPEYVNSRMLQAMTGGGAFKSRDSLVKPAEKDERGNELMQAPRQSMAESFSSRIFRGNQSQATVNGVAPPTSRWQRART